MILLDTNVISQTASKRPDPGVVAWLDDQPTDTLYLSTITVAELRYGVAILPRGRRRAELEARVEDIVLPLFAGRILPFDEAATSSFAALRADARKRGRAISITDGYIAAIALSRTFTVATRDTSPFEAAGLRVINPFDGG